MQVTSLNPDLQKNLVASLELGLTTLGVDAVFTLCCDFIQVSQAEGRREGGLVYLRVPQSIHYTYLDCDCLLQVLGCHMIRQKLQASPIYEPLRPFLKLILNLILR